VTQDVICGRFKVGNEKPDGLTGAGAPALARRTTVCTGLTFIAASAMLPPMRSLRETGFGMFLARADRGRPGGG
jgi:hypothetical protein